MVSEWLSFSASCDATATNPSLVESAYRSIHEPGAWTQLLRELQHVLEADACDVSVHDFTIRRGAIALHCGGYREPFVSGYAHTFGPLNPWMQRPECYAEDGCWLGEEVVSSSTVTSCAFYRSWLEPQGLLYRLSGRFCAWENGQSISRRCGVARLSETKRRSFCNASSRICATLYASTAKSFSMTKPAGRSFDLTMLERVARQ